MSCQDKYGYKPRFILFCLWLVLSIRCVQAEPQSFHIQYQAENDYLSAGTANWSLSKQDSGWVMQLSTSPSRLIRMAGVGKVVETAILSTPEPPFKAIAYSYKDSKRTRKNYSAALTEKGDEIVITRADQTIVVPAIDGGIINRLSATLAISTALTGNPVFDRLQFKVLDRNGIREMVFDNLGTETIKIGNQSFDAHVVESGRPGSTRKTRTWFARIGTTDGSERLLPVKIEQYKKEALVLRLSLSKYTLQ